jgi:predicted secreted Zn-dependent protease
MSSSTASDLDISDRVSHYFITGSTVHEIAHCMRVACPRERGRHFAAWTSWQVRWSILEKADATFGAPVVGLEIVTRLPRWIPVAASTELANAWREFEEGLVAHEAGHREIAIQAGLTILDTLRSSRPFESDIIQAEVDRVLARAREKENAYDERTCHGATDPRIGALWRLSWDA